jgi:hypothetical protein
MVVCISGVVQNPNTYSIIGLTLTFSAAPPTGTNNIGVLYLGIPATSVTTPGNTAYLSSTEFTATAGQTTFTPSGTYQVGFINVIRNGSQLAPSDYTATNGTTVVLNTACTVGDSVVVQVYNLVSVSNALPLTGGTVTGATTFNSTLTTNSNVNLSVSSGNVGIGTATPVNKVTIAGGITLTPTYETYLVNSYYNSGWKYGANGFAWGIGNNFGGSTNGVTIAVTSVNAGGAGAALTWDPAFNVDSTGGVRIKTTSNIFNGLINEALTVNNGTNGNAATFSTNATGGFPVLYLRHQVAGSNNQIIFITSSGTAGSITSNGLAVAYNTSSDYRLKENVQPMVGALDKVIQLKPCTYNWKHDGSDGQGFIAHELQAIVPDAVVGEKDAVNEDGSIKPQGVDTSLLVATLTAAIQELKAELDACKAEIATLKGNIPTPPDEVTE